MANYIIIGGDNKEYGPVSEAEVRQWIAEGRLSAESRVKAESDAEFRTLALFPEFAGALRPAAAPGTIAPIKGATEFAENDYDLDIVACFSRGWELLKNNMNVVFAGAVIYVLIEFVANGLSNIPLIGSLFSLANFVCSGPLIGGVYCMFLRANRGEKTEIGDIFSGFSRFPQLFLGILVPTLLIGLCLTPLFIVLGVKLIPMMGQLHQLRNLQPGTPPDMETIHALMHVLVSALPVALVCAIPTTYLSVCLKFTVPLIADRRMDFAAAMRTSWRMVNKHWWMIFGLTLLISLLNLAGFLACCLGLLITIPVGIAALMIAYETIFGTERN